MIATRISVTNFGVPNLIKQHPLAVDAYGNMLDIADGQTGYLVRRLTGGRPGIEYYLGMPLVVSINATRDEVIEKIKKPGVMRLYPVSEDGEEIPGAPVAVLEVSPDEVYHGVDAPHWMRLDRVFDALDRSMTAMEAKDMIIGEVTKSLLENNTALQNGAVRLLDTANTTITVANGIERPDLDIDHIITRVVEEVTSSKEEEPNKQPWFVQLLNGSFGQSLVSIANNVTGRKAGR